MAEKLEDISVLLADSDELVRGVLMSMLRQQGLRNIQAVANLERFCEGVREQPRDLLIVADDLGEEVFRTVKDVRHNRLGINPFTVVTMLISPGNNDAVKRAILCGADDVLIKPVAPGRILDRTKKVAYNRTPFIATSDYVGPDRRRGDRKSEIPLLNVVNTLKEKMDGRNPPLSEIRAAINKEMTNIHSAKLESHGLKLGWVCNQIISAYQAKTIDSTLQDNIYTLIGCLEEAGRTALAINERDLAKICQTFARRIEEMAEHYELPAPESLQVVETLTKAFSMAREAVAQPTSAIQSATA